MSSRAGSTQFPALPPLVSQQHQYAHLPQQSPPNQPQQNPYQALHPSQISPYSANSSSNSPPDSAYPRKRPTLRSAEEGGANANANGIATSASVSPDSPTFEHDGGEEEDDDDEEHGKGWPTWTQLRRRVALSWRMLRFATVIKFISLFVVCLFVARFLSHRIEDRNKASHYSVVALLRDMSPSHLQSDKWQFAFQWSALMSWNAQVIGRNILVFVDAEDTCRFLESHIRDIQCFVIPAPQCFHAEYKKPRLDCIFSIAHAHAPTNTIVYVNGDVLIGPDLSAAIRMVETKHDRFVLTGRRTDLAVTTDMLEQFRSSNFVQKLIQTAKESGHLHKPDAIDLFVYQRSEFERKPVLSNFPPFLAAAPFWDSWFLSQAILDENVATIDLSASVLLVHLDRGKVPRSARVGAPYNEDLVRHLSGNNFKVGSSVENCDLALVGDCLKGVSAPAGSGVATTGVGAGAVHPGATEAVTAGGCSIIANPNVTDLVLFTKRASKEGVLAVLTVNSGYLPIALNWICWAERIKFNNFILIAEDLAAAAKLKARGIPVVVPKNAPESKAAAEYGSVAFQETMTFRTEYLMTVLNAGFHFLTADMDAIWLDDPIPYLDSRIDLQGQTHKDTRLSGGFIAVRASTYGRYFWNKVIECQRNNALFLASHANDATKKADGTPIPLSYDPSQYTEQFCINELTRTLSTQPLFTRKLLDPYAFPDGASFFDRHESQLRGVTPAVIHNNWIVGTSAKQKRLAEWGLNAADEETEECLVAESMPFPDLRPPNEFRLKIRVLTYNRPESLKRLLKSLQEADYLGDQVFLEISIDHPIPTPEEEDVAKWNEVTQISSAFEWTHGEKSVVEQPHNIGLVGQWTRGWSPMQGDDNELCLFLEDDVSVTPFFYRWLKPVIAKYYLDRKNFDPRMFGISLQRQHTILGETHQVRYGARTPDDVINRMNINNEKERKASHLYRYQLLGTWGALFFPQHWRAFLNWLEMKKVDTIQGTSSQSVPCVPTLLSNKWWQANPHKVWTQWFIRFAYEMGYYSLYTNFPDGTALAINHREPGLNFNKAKGPMHAPVTVLTEQHLLLPPMSEIPIFDFHFNLITNPDTLVWRKQLTNEKFLGITTATTTPVAGNTLPPPPTMLNQQCWTLDLLTIQLKKEAEARAEAAAAAAAAEAALVQARLAEESSKANVDKQKATDAALNVVMQADAKKEAERLRKAELAKREAEDRDRKKAEAAKLKKAEQEKEKAKGREWDDHTHTASEKLKNRKDELQIMSKLPDKFIGSFFDGNVPDTARHLRYLSSLAPVLTAYPKSNYLTVSDGRFGMVAAFIESHMDKESKVTASDVLDPTLIIAKEKLKKISNFQKLNPARLSLDDDAVDFAVSLEAFAHHEKPMSVVSEMVRVSKKGVVLLEPHDTPLDDKHVVKGFSAAFKRSLEPFAGKQGVGNGDRADANEFYKLAQKNKLFLFFKIFKDDSDIDLAKKEEAAGARPWAMLATVMLKKAPSTKQNAEFVKAGFTAVPISG